MDSLEQLVTDTLDEHAGHAPEFRLTGRSLIWRLDVPRRRRPWGRWIGSAIAVAAVTLLAVSLSLGWWSLNDSEYAGGNAGSSYGAAGGGGGSSAAGGQANASGTAPSAPGSAPAVLHRIRYHRITVDVPASLPVYGRLCGRPHDMVLALVRGGLSMGCPITETRAIARVVWLSPRREGSVYASLATSPTTVHGIAARIGFGRLPHSRGVSGVLVIPSKSLVVGATFPTRAAVAAVLDSVRFG